MNRRSSQSSRRLWHRLVLPLFALPMLAVGTLWSPTADARPEAVVPSVRSASIRHLLDSFVNSGIALFEIDCLGTPMFPRHLEAFRNSVDRDDTASAEHPRALNTELAYGPATQTATVSPGSMSAFSAAI